MESKMRSRRIVRAFSLVEIMVVLVVLMVLAAVLYPSIAGHGRTKQGKATTPLSKAHDTVCQSNLRSVRQSIEAFKAGDSEERLPASLDELKLPSEVTHCDVSKEAYLYNPQTGEVHCPFVGHSSF
jgi:competence protein ComGC